ncbi:hypothetical protein IscW_ISCW012756 [Ixodes scapularis]|uniref:Uncharacterized protein n=1 Tax=Ixodes scapularis TaxID=6945 RepID=B7QB51_IXOSC|nr:hypothetical protein IscW_ISCW012756 [Ixodes scapularis]|eukprot:XP_002412777.1 hypothetical protein IscW_ISCW012756 [Ixodes scapularis]
MGTLVSEHAAEGKMRRGWRPLEIERHDVARARLCGASRAAGAMWSVSPRHSAGFWRTFTQGAGRFLQAAGSPGRAPVGDPFRGGLVHPRTVRVFRAGRPQFRFI